MKYGIQFATEDTRGAIQPSEGEYQVKISGTIVGRFNDADEVKDKLTMMDDVDARSARVSRWDVNAGKYVPVTVRWTGNGVVLAS